MGRIVFQCYPPVSEVPMTSALARRPFPLIPLALLAACNTETSNERVLGIQAMSFANSEWSEPVHLDAPINSRCQDQTPTMSKDELSLYFLSEDRKSTRLNSSHRTISYAVFCLKKKKKRESKTSAEE